MPSKIFPKKTYVIGAAVPAETNLVDNRTNTTRTALEANINLPNNQKTTANTQLESNIIIPNSRATGAFESLESSINIPNNRSTSSHNSLESNITIPDSRTNTTNTSLESNITIPSNQTQNANTNVEVNPILPNNQSNDSLTSLESNIVVPDNQSGDSMTQLESNIIMPANQTQNANTSLESNITIPNSRTTDAMTALESDITFPNSRVADATTSIESNITMPNNRTNIGGTVEGPPQWQSQNNTSSQTDASSVVITKPAGVVSGDLMVVFIGISNTTAAQVNTLAGWTLIRTDEITVAGGGAAESHVRSFYRIADGTEGTTFTFTFTATASEIGTQIHRINMNHASSPIDAHTGATLLATALDPDPSAPAVTTVANNCLVLAYLFHSHLALSNTHTPPASHDERVDNTGGGGTTRWGHTMATRVFATPGSQAAVEFDCTETVATDAIMQRISINPGVFTLP